MAVEGGENDERVRERNLATKYKPCVSPVHGGGHPSVPASTTLEVRMASSRASSTCEHEETLKKTAIQNACVRYGLVH